MATGCLVAAAISLFAQGGVARLEVASVKPTAPNHDGFSFTYVGDTVRAVGVPVPLHSGADAMFQDRASTDRALEFEVISIRRAERPTGPPGNSLRTLPGGRLEINAVTLQAIILWAYELRPYADTLEGSSELLKQNYTISAKAPVDVALPDQQGVFPAMARAMLRDRFKLRVSQRQELGYTSAPC